MHGIPLLCLKELRALRPDLDTVWMPAIRHHAALLARGLDEADEIQRYEKNAYCANYFAPPTPSCPHLFKATDALRPFDPLAP